MFLSFTDVAFCYEGAPDPAIQDLRFTVGPGWTGVVGPNGSGKTTVLRLAAGELAPSSGQVSAPLGVYCPQRTDHPSVNLETLLEDQGPRARGLCVVLGLALDWAERWESLSHGERKRAQIAAALYPDPACLAVDEPTNHLDRIARDQVGRALAAFRGVGLLVSHDRDLLDDLCNQCLFLGPEGPVLRPGGYSAGARQGEVERTELLRQRDKARREVRALERERHQRREQTAKGERQRSKRGLAKGDRDARAKVDAARVTDSDSGQRLRQLDGPLRQAREREAGLDVARAFRLGVTLEGECSPRDLLLAIPAQELHLGGGYTLALPALVLRPGDRVGLEGPNGSGKTTLMRRLAADLTAAGVPTAFLPQETSALDARAILRDFRTLPPERLGRAMALVRRLGSDPERLLQSCEPSPGELRKLLLTSPARIPHIIILDEPTNHLDLPAVECLEEALEGCAAALLLVSHDRRFLDRLVRRRWRIVPMDPGRWTLEVD
jgi:ATPase subunit of ABC transporter with duplicated ATPase domains